MASAAPARPRQSPRQSGPFHNSYLYSKSCVLHLTHLNYQASPLQAITRAFHSAAGFPWLPAVMDHEDSQIWTAQEDDRLREALILNKKGTKNWREVAAHVGTKTAHQCQQRWKNTLNPDVLRIKGRWTTEVCDHFFLLRLVDPPGKASGGAILAPSGGAMCLCVCAHWLGDGATYCAAPRWSPDNSCGGTCTRGERQLA